MDFDPKTGVYYPENKATFLFVTREGTTGALQLNGLVTGLPGPEDVRMRFQLPDPPEEPGKPADSNPSTAPTAASSSRISSSTRRRTSSGNTVSGDAKNARYLTSPAATLAIRNKCPTAYRPSGDRA